MSLSLHKRQVLFQQIDIYPVVTEKFCNGKSSLDILKALVDANIKIVQLREKNKTSRELYKLAEQYRKITEDHHILFIIDDYIDIAMAVNADGVHLGQNDFPFEYARNLSKELLIGVSTHNLQEIEYAQKFDISYINVGPIFQTQTKELNSMEVIGIEKMQIWMPSIHIPFTVMGGIKKHNIPLLHKLGVSRFAMVTEITQSKNIPETILKLRQSIQG